MDQDKKPVRMKSANPDDRASDRLISQHHMTAAMEAIRTSFLANGGALLAAMTFLGDTISAQGQVPTGWLAASFGLFGTGLVLAILAAIAMYRLQQETEDDLAKKRSGVSVSHPNIRWLLYGSLYVFLVAMGCSGYALFLASEMQPPAEAAASTGPTGPVVVDAGA